MFTNKQKAIALRLPICICRRYSSYLQPNNTVVIYLHIYCEQQLQGTRSATIKWQLYFTRVPLSWGDFLQASIELLKFVNLPDKKVSVSPGHFGICDVDHILVDVEVNF